MSLSRLNRGISGGIHDPRESGTGAVQAQIRTERGYARRTTEAATQSKLVAALYRERLAAIRAGKMVGSLPEVHDNMSIADITNAQERLNSIMGRPKDYDFLSADPNAPKDKSAPMPTNGSLESDSAAPAVRRGGIIPRPTPPEGLPPGDQQPGPAQSPVVTQMIKDGTVPPGSDVSRTGAGFSVRMDSESGPRDVQVTPSASAALVAKYDASALEQYGKGWNELSPDQRAAMLRSTPATGQAGGVVTDPGVTSFNHRGERAVQGDYAGTPIAQRSPSGIEYDPAQDQTMTRVLPGGIAQTNVGGTQVRLTGAPQLPAGAAAGVLIDPKYQTPGASPMGTVSYRPPTTPPVGTGLSPEVSSMTPPGDRSQGTSADYGLPPGDPSQGTAPSTTMGLPPGDPSQGTAPRNPMLALGTPPGDPSTGTAQYPPQSLPPGDPAGGGAPPVVSNMKATPTISQIIPPTIPPAAPAAPETPLQPTGVPQAPSSFNAPAAPAKKLPDDDELESRARNRYAY